MVKMESRLVGDEDSLEEVTTEDESVEGLSTNDAIVWTSQEIMQAKLWLASGLQNNDISHEVGMKLMKTFDSARVSQADDERSGDSSQAMIDTKIF